MGSDASPERTGQEDELSGKPGARSPGEPPEAPRGRKAARKEGADPAATEEKPDAEQLSFEQIVAALQGIVEQLERGDAPLEQALATYERGVRLSRLGARRLDEAERRIEILMSDNEDGVRARPLEKEPETR